MYQGLRTAIYRVGDLARAKAWYSKVLGSGPYFDEPFYVGYNVAGYELGLVPEESEGPNGAGGVFVYWGVPDAAAELARLESLGAVRGGPHQGVEDVGGGILVATVLDPFGNVFGIIQNPHFKLG